MKENENKEHEKNAFQAEREDKSYIKNPPEVPDELVEDEDDLLNRDEETRERG